MERTAIKTDRYYNLFQQLCRSWTGEEINLRSNEPGARSLEKQCGQGHMECAFRKQSQEAILECFNAVQCTRSQLDEKLDVASTTRKT